MPFLYTPSGSSLPISSVEIPVRSPTLPINLWIRTSWIGADWSDFPSDTRNANWRGMPTTIYQQISAGDTVLAGQATVSVAAVKREEQGIFDTDDWGVAFDELAPLAQPVEGPGIVQFLGHGAILGKSWPTGVAITTDLLVLRSSLIPAKAPPYGHRAKTIEISDVIRDHPNVTESLRQLNADLKNVVDWLDSKRGDFRPVSKPPEQPIMPPKVIFGPQETTLKYCRPNESEPPPATKSPSKKKRELPPT